MKAKLAIVAVLVFGVVVLSHAYVRGYPPFTSQFVQTCDRAIKERLVVPSTYQRLSVDESKRTITFDEFFADPYRAVSEVTRNAMIKSARKQPAQLVALIEHEAQDSLGAPNRTTATCTFISLEGDDAPSRTSWVALDGEYNVKWAARQPNAALLRRKWPEQ
jgi:hypothetical protein